MKKSVHSLLTAGFAAQANDTANTTGYVTADTTPSSNLQPPTVSTMKKLLLIPVLLASFAGASATASEIFEFEVTTTTANETFAIPLSGSLNDTFSYKSYSWNITWDDGATQTASSSGIGAPQNDRNSPGIPHTYAVPGTYTVTLTPAGSEDAWLAAFGFCSSIYGANEQDNKNRLTKLVSPLTPLMTRTSAQLSSGTAPTYEWAYTFFGCQNLVMGDGFTFSTGWNTITSVGNWFAQGMFSNCSGEAFTMNSVFNLPAGITSAGTFFAAYMFEYCSGEAFSMNSVFNLPAGITSQGGAFASGMFRVCSGASFNMNSVFNLPAGITSAGASFAAQMFNGCSGEAFTMNSVFNLPAGITTVGNSFANAMFNGCSGEAFTMNSVFNLPAGITSAGNDFANAMFSGCSGEAFTMNSVFNLPAGITSAGTNFARSMFQYCSGESLTMNSVFNLPAGITSAGNDFANAMFSGCSGEAFTMNSVFNLPPGITTVGNYFANSMFTRCSGEAFTMNSVFNLPSGITTVGNSFAAYMLQYCSGESFTMNSVFNLPAGITSVGASFASSMFRECSGAAFTMNSVFNLPAGITTVGDSFANSMFYRCSGASFQVNDVFVFPLLDSAELNKGSVFASTFYNLGTASPQNRTATSIINGNGLPNSNRSTFSSSGCFADRAHINARWGGSGTNANNTLFVSHSSLTFPSADEGYAPVATRTVTVYNLGATTINGVSHDSTLATDFNLGTLSDTTLPPGGSVTFTVAPQDNLPAGAHAGTITISATGCANKTLGLSFTVLAHDTAFDIPDWDGSGIRITAFTVTPISNGDVTVDLDAVCASSLNPSKIRLLIFEDLSAPVPLSSPSSPDDITSHPSAVPPHHRAAWNFTLPSAPDRAFFRVTHED